MKIIDNEKACTGKPYRLRLPFCERNVKCMLSCGAFFAESAQARAAAPVQVRSRKPPRLRRRTAYTAQAARPGASIVFIIPSLAAGARRLHDTGRSGWLQLLMLIPCIGSIILIIWWCEDSKGDNEYGPSPKYPGKTM